MATAISINDDKKKYVIEDTLNIFIESGDIITKESGINTIVTSNNQTMNDKGGLSGHIYNASDSIYRKLIDSAQYNLKEYECKPIKNNLESFKFVFHIYIPKNTGSNGAYQSFKNIFAIADDLSISSIVVPILGLNRSNISLDDFIIGFINAMHELINKIKKYPNLKHPFKNIYIIDNDSQKIKKIQDKFNELYPQISSELSSRPSRVRVLFKPDESTSSRPPRVLFKPDESKKDKDEKCPVCIDNIKNPYTVQCCGKTFCKECIDEAIKRNASCPMCMKVYGIKKGNQPDGYYSYYEYKEPLKGYENYGHIEIIFTLPMGIQRSDHPNPGTPYTGRNIKVYLPNNDEGKEISKLLKIAFDNKILFTVGTSRTSGLDNVITFNDIHLKTAKTGQFGYPDPNYFNRVRGELKSKGIE